MKKIAVILSVIMLFVGLITMPVYGDSATVALSKSEVTVGSNVTVTVRYNADYSMYAIDATVTYNSAVLQYVSGGTNTGSSVKIVEALSGERTTSANIVFKAIAEGAGSIAFSAKASGEGDGSASSGATVTVAAPKPSSNANLSSIKLSEGTLTPRFSTARTDYTANVGYNVSKITISANAAAGDSTVTGAGTFDLKPGENKYMLTVTAASGDKKNYNITIKRMTEAEETAAKEEARKSNPYLIEVNGTDYYLKDDLSALGDINGFTLSSIERKGASVGIFYDKNNKYQLYWATDESGANGTFFVADKNNKFSKLDYIKIGNNLYIIEPFEDDISVNNQYIPAKYDLNGKSIDCYIYNDVDISDFYIFNCYTNGRNGYYKYDSAENTMQREPVFIATEPTVSQEPSEGLLDKFNNLNLQAKIVLSLLLFAGLLVFVLIVLLIVKAAKRGSKLGDVSEDGDSGGFNNIISDSDLIMDTQPENILPDESYSADSGPEENYGEKEDTEDTPDEGEQDDSDPTSEFIDPEDDF